MAVRVRTLADWAVRAATSGCRSVAIMATAKRCLMAFRKALVRKYPADRLTVERTADSWFKKRSARS